jgi:hypothetical protein
MRFSLKWILAGMAYVAIAAAAFARDEWWYTDILSALTLLAVVYAILVTAFASGRRRIAAAGFVVASISFIFCAAYGGDGVPTTRLLGAAGISPFPQQPTGDQQYLASAKIISTRTDEKGRSSVKYGMPSGHVTGITLSATSPKTPNFLEYLRRFRVANAVSAMAFGLIGALVGLMAFRAPGPEGKQRRNGD